MNIYVRLEQVASPLQADEPALLLEGSWPTALRYPQRDSLDEAIDSRCGWIDPLAAELAAQLAHESRIDSLQWPYSTALLANLGALRLRYFFVKLLRWVAYCREVRTPNSGDHWRLFADEGDTAYVATFRALCAAYRVRGEVVQMDRAPTSALVPPKPIARWRRALTPFVASTVESTVAPAESLGRRVLLCGDSNLLGPLCQEIAARGHQTAWLSDEPVLKLKLRMPGVRQLVCESSRASENAFGPADVPSLWTDEGVDLAAPVQIWLNDLRAEQGPRWTRWLRTIDHHLRRYRPDTLVVGEDATPFARAAVLTARSLGIRSIVAQHGAPAVRFGFAPLLADEFAAWDNASRDQLIDWGVEKERVTVAGSLALDQSRARIEALPRMHRRASTRTFLWLASLPARDDRPDAVEYHLTTATHAAMLRDAGAELASLQGVKVLIRPHPRDVAAFDWRAWLKEFPTLDARIVTRGHWTTWLSRAEAVLSCGSSAGLEAARLGWPVVQLLPAGSSNLLSAARWGLIGTARNRTELCPLLERALCASSRRVPKFSPTLAAARIADLIEDRRKEAEVRARSTIVYEESLCLPT